MVETRPVNVALRALRELTGLGTEEAICQAALRAAADLLGCHTVHLWLRPRDDSPLLHFGLTADPEIGLADCPLADEEEWVQELLSGRAKTVEVPEPAASRYDLRLAVAMRSAGEVVGCLAVGGGLAGRELSGSELRQFRMFARSVAQAIISCRARFAQPVFESTLGAVAARLHGLLEYSPDAVVVTTRSGRIARINERAAMLFGYGPGELAGRPVETLVPDGLASLHAEHREEFWERPETHRRRLQARDLPCRRRDGTTFYADINLQVVNSSGGPFVVAVVRDVEDRRRREQALHRRLEIERALLEASARFVAPVAIDEAVRGALADLGRLTGARSASLWLYDARRLTATATERWLRADTVDGPQLPEALHRDAVGWLFDRLATGAALSLFTAELPPAATAVRELFAAARAETVIFLPFEAGSGVAGFLSVTDPAGELTWSEHDFSLLKLLADTIARALARQRVEQALRASEEHYRLLVELSPDAVLICDETQIRYANSAAAAFFGAPDASSLIGLSPLAIVPPDRQEWARRRLLNLIASDRGAEAREYALMRLDGEVVDAEIAASPFPLGDRPAALFLIRDVTARKEAERAARLSALGQLAEGVAHDFSNLLQSIGYAAQMAARQANDESLLTNLETIRRSVEDATAVVRRIQDFGRHRADDQLTPIEDLAQTVRDAVLMARPHWEGEGRPPIRVVERLEPAGPVLGHASELREVLLNIIINAVQAMPDGGTLTVASGVDEEGAWVSVADTGRGMTRQVLERVFEPYYSTKGNAGHGVGLAVAYGIIRRHRGRIDVESEPQLGSEFIVRLPLARPEELSDETRSVRVLAVDDDPEVREVLARMLEALSCEVTEADDAATALERCEHQRFDVVLTDFHLGDRNGIELATDIHSLYPGVPVILITGYGGELACDAVDLVLRKPYSLADLRAAVDQLVGR